MEPPDPLLKPALLPSLSMGREWEGTGSGGDGGREWIGIIDFGLGFVRMWIFVRARVRKARPDRCRERAQAFSYPSRIWTG